MDALTLPNTARPQRFAIHGEYSVACGPAVRLAGRGVCSTSMCLFALMFLLATPRGSQPFSGAVAAEQERPASTGTDGKTAADSRSEDNDVTFSADEALEAIRKQVPAARAVPVKPNIIEMIAGHYVRATPGTLAGSEFYFFPNKTYLWLHRSCMPPLWLGDRGTWDYRDGFLRLKTDETIRSVPAPLNNTYFPVIVPAKYAVRDGRKAEEKLPVSSLAPGRQAVGSEKAEGLILAGTRYGLARVVKEGLGWEYLLAYAYRKQENISAQQLKMTSEQVVEERFQQLIKQRQQERR